jgi:hypothetical protein
LDKALCAFPVSLIRVASSFLITSVTWLLWLLQCNNSA